jgi:hypothetical protein
MTTPYSDYQFFLHNKISELREQGLGYKRISDILNEEGVLTVRGKVFTNSHVHSIMKKKNIREQRFLSSSWTMSNKTDHTGTQPHQVTKTSL